MDRNSFPIEIAIALLVLAGILYVGRYITEKTVPGPTTTQPAATAPR